MRGFEDVRRKTLPFRRIRGKIDEIGSLIPRLLDKRTPDTVLEINQKIVDHATVEVLKPDTESLVVVEEAGLTLDIPFYKKTFLASYFLVQVVVRKIG